VSTLIKSGTWEEKNAKYLYPPQIWRSCALDSLCFISNKKRQQQQEQQEALSQKVARKRLASESAFPPKKKSYH
jgi:hypothetical protein